MNRPVGRACDWEAISMNVQIIVTPNGERLVLIPEAEYKALLEAVQDGDDAAHAHAFFGRLEAGQAELLPDAMVSRILDGESRITVWREHRGLTATAVARAAGITAPTLSQIENGVRTGSVDVLRRIAGALRVNLDDIA